LSKQVVLCLAVALGSSILGFTNSFFLEKPSLQNQALSHPSDPESEESQPATQLGESAGSVSQKSDVLSEANDIDQSIVHNRTSRDLVLECYEKGVWRFDKCRNQFVSEIKCLVSHKQLFLSFFITLCGPTPSFTKPFSQQVSSHRNHPLVHQLRDEDSQSRVVFQPEEGIDETIEAEFPIRHASHNRTARDANNPCFHYIEARTWDSCRQKYVDKVHCYSTHAACYRALAQGYSYPACQVVFGYPQAKYISKCAALPIDCQCAS
ncbi:unnamed protein product, partial [Porites lobata]